MMSVFVCVVCECECGGFVCVWFVVGVVRFCVGCVYGLGVYVVCVGVVFLGVSVCVWCGVVCVYVWCGCCVCV